MDILKRKELEFYIEQGLVEKVYINDDDRKDLNEKYHENFDEFDDGMVEGYFFEVSTDESRLGKYDFYKWEFIEELEDSKNLDKRIEQYISYENCLSLKTINKNISFFKTILIIFIILFILGFFIILLSISKW